MGTTEFAKGFMFGVLIAAVVAVNLGAASQLRWNKEEVIPVCLVKGVIGGFDPINGNPIGNRWNKKEVLPICEVTTGIGGFVPVNGNTIGNAWTKAEVKPFVVVTPHGTGFIAGGRL
jgi:hypothetical protein